MDASVLAIFLVKKKKPSKIQQNNRNHKNKQAKARSQNRLLAEDETGGCSCLSRASVGSGMSGKGAGSARLPPAVGCGGLCAERVSTSGGQQWPAGGAEPGSTAAIPGSGVSLHGRAHIAMEFCAIPAWTRNLLILLGKFTYKPSLCTCDTEWATLKYRVLMCCGLKY